MTQVPRDPGDPTADPAAVVAHPDGDSPTVPILRTASILEAGYVRGWQHANYPARAVFHAFGVAHKGRDA